MKLAQEYVAAAVELARAQRFEVLARLVDLRLRGSGEPLLVSLSAGERSIVSPPLEIDEPDHNALLYEIFHLLEGQRENAAIDTMRRVAAELLMQGLNRGEPDDYVELAAQLVEHTLVVENVDLSIRIQQQLYGYLESRLTKPFLQLIELDGRELARATLAIDVWLAVMPVQPPWSEHLTGRIETMLVKSIERLDRGDLALRERFELLSFAYQALLKVLPASAGQKLWRICRLLAIRAPQFSRRWLAECQHLGLELTAVPDWRQKFLAGIRRSPWSQILASPELRNLMERTLKSLKVEEEFKVAGADAGEPEVAGSVSSSPFGDLTDLGRKLYRGSTFALDRAMKSVVRNDLILGTA